MWSAPAATLAVLAAILGGSDAAPGAAAERQLVSGIPTVQSQTPGNHGNGGVDPKLFHCGLDPKVTAADLPFFIPDILKMWDSACGRNRGVFVMKPADGHTYGCGNLPESFGVPNVGVLTNLTATESTTAVHALDKFIQAVYNTTITKDSSACDFAGLSTLTCGREEPWRSAPWVEKLQAPIRAVNIGGLFVLEAWILPSFVNWGPESGILDQHSFSLKCQELGICQKLKDHFKNWYVEQDFLDMKSMGLNSIRLPVGWWFFADKAGISPGPYIIPDEDLYAHDHPLTNVLRWANNAGLQVILDLHGAPGSQNGLDNSGISSPDPNNLVWGETWLYSPDHMANTIKTLAAMAEYINRMEAQYSLDNVMALELLNEPWAFLDIGRVRDFYIESIEAVRLVRPHLPIIIHDSFRGFFWASLLKNFPYKNVFLDSHIYHGFNPSDAASDTAKTDRQKQFVHEQMACGYSSMLRYQTCSALPTFVGEWSLAIDNCMGRLDPKFDDYGQCKHVKDRLRESWWDRHIQSFASRQIATFEREMGWSFWCYKLDDHAETEEASAYFWSFRMAVRKGYIDTTYPSGACLHPAQDDWNESVKPLPTAKPLPEGNDNPVAPSGQAQQEVASHEDDDVPPEAAELSSDPHEAQHSSAGAAFPAVFVVFAALGMVAALVVYRRREVQRPAGPQGTFSVPTLGRRAYTNLDDSAVPQA